MLVRYEALWLKKDCVADKDAAGSANSVIHIGRSGYKAWSCPSHEARPAKSPYQCVARKSAEQPCFGLILWHDALNCFSQSSPTPEPDVEGRETRMECLRGRMVDMKNSAASVGDASEPPTLVGISGSLKVSRCVGGDVESRRDVIAPVKSSDESGRLWTMGTKGRDRPDVGE